MRDNRGISLIELLVAIAAMSIVTAAVVGFLNVSLQTYRSTNQDIDLQYEAQLVTNQLKDLLIDANNTVSYDTESVGGSEERVMKIYNKVSSTDGTVAEIRWKQAEGKLYYAKYSHDIEHNTTSSTPLIEPSLMGEHMTDFSVDLTGLPSGKILFTMNFDVGDRTYAGTSTVTLRNKVVQFVTGDPFDENLDYSLSTVSSVDVTPNDAVVHVGSTKQFSAKVNGENSPSQKVTWEISGQNPALGTSIDSNGVLTVDPYETANNITVIATSSYDTSVSGAVSVGIDGNPEVFEVVVSPSNINVGRGGTQPFTAKVTAEEGANFGVVWEVTGNASKGTTISSDGTLTVGAGETSSTLTVTAKSIEDGTKSDSVTVNVVQITEITISGPDSVKRSSSNKYTASVKAGSTASVAGLTDVVWSISVSNGAKGITIDANTGIVTISKDATIGATFTIKATSKYDSNISATKKVTVSYR